MTEYQRAINDEGNPCYHTIVKCFYCGKKIKCNCKEEMKGGVNGS